MGKQENLNLCLGRWGGRRPGSGRRRIHSKGVAHRERERVTSRTSLHINFKVKTFIRNKVCLRILKRAILNSRAKGLRIIHFSLQSNHVHFIVEATSNDILTTGMRSLTVTFAKGIGKGRIQLERYHLHVLRTLRETRHAVHYVLFNQQKHSNLKRAHVDHFSSLAVIKNLKALVKASKMTIVTNRIEMNFLDDPKGWLIRQALDQQIC